MDLSSQQSNQYQTRSYTGLASAALVLGILAIPASFVLIGLVFGVLAVIFGAIALKGSRRNKAIVGIVTGSIGIVSGAVVLALSFNSYFSVQQRADDSSRLSDVATLERQIVTAWAENGQLPTSDTINTTDLTAIESVASSGDPTATTAIYLSGTSCDGVVSDAAFSVSILLTDDTVHCRGMDG